MHFVNFEAGHMLWIRDIHEKVLNEQRGFDLVKLGESCSKKGPCLTLMNDREAIACGGLVFLFPETAEIWLRLSMQGRGPHAVRELKAQMFRGSRNTIWTVSRLQLNSAGRRTRGSLSGLG